MSIKAAFRALLWLGLGASFIGCPAQAQNPAPRPPNVLLIIVDDLNNDLGCYGHPLVKSPNIDRLAQRGVRFDRAYCQYPLCNPSRTSFLSGRRPDTTRIFDNSTPPRTYLGNNVQFLPNYLHANDYFTARIGKILHESSFESTMSWDVSEDAASPLAFHLTYPAVGGPLAWESNSHTDAQEPDGATARRVAQLLEQHPQEPFFIAAGFAKPHLPFVAPAPYFALYPLNQIQFPPDPPGDRDDIPLVALNYVPGGWQDQMTDTEKRQAIQAYFACISFIDAQVGILLDAVQRSGLSDDTIIVFLGDHGYHLSEHRGLWRKQSLFEESARAPLIIAAPGKRAGAVCPHPVELVDLYPTLDDLCGLPHPDGLQGQSLVPLLEDASCAWPRAAFTQLSKGKQGAGRAVRDARYRYGDWGSDATAELYDLWDDPREYTNRAHDPAYAAILAQMQSLLRGGPVANGR